LLSWNAAPPKRRDRVGAGERIGAAAVGIIGIPFAWAHPKFAGIALWPIGKEIVEIDALPPRNFSAPAKR